MRTFRGTVARASGSSLPALLTGKEVCELLRLEGDPYMALYHLRRTGVLKGISFRGHRPGRAGYRYRRDDILRLMQGDAA